MAAAQRTRGTVFALDIEPAMIEATGRKAGELGVANVRCVLRDFIADGTGLEDGAVGYAMLFNSMNSPNLGNFPAVLTVLPWCDFIRFQD